MYIIRNRCIINIAQIVISTRFDSVKCVYRSFHKMHTLSSSSTLNPIAKNSFERFNNIVKSFQDNREYRGLILENGIKILLISDSTTDKSAAALAVDVGHMSDPENIPGLAHFCEHMLFLGTEQYPVENDYTTYLNENGGSSNASTSGDCTKYYFDVVPDKFEGALDRFAQFFISPLFTESATDREINAVNSEHEKNLALDVWRIRQVNKSLANPNHPYSKFGTGNEKTLSEIPKTMGINIRKELIKFYEKWYSSNLMYLAVLGKESLDDLEKMVVSKFSKIIDKKITAPRWNDGPYLENQYATKTFVVPVKDTRSLTLSFPTPDLDQYYKSGPEQYLSYLFGHEGKGSILSELKAKGWSNDLMAGHSTSARGFGFFDIIVDLTQEGFENVDEILKIIFQYINHMREQKPQKRIFTEYCNLSEIQFRFKDKENPISMVTNIIQGMQVYPLEEVLSAPYLFTEWRPDLIENLLNILTPKNARVVVVGQKFESSCESTEYWYGTKFHNEKISETVLKTLENCGENPNLHLPEPNPFIPTNFDLLPAESDSQKYPIVLHDTPVFRVWYKQDTEFLKPKTIMNFDFSNPIAYSDPLNCNLTQLFVYLFRDYLNEYLYTAELGGLKLGISNTSYGISITISGYSDKQKILLQKILDDLFTFEIDPKRFDILKEQYSRTLNNFKAELPYQHAIYYLALLLTEYAWTKQELLEALSLVTIERLQVFIKELLSRLHVECLIYGNTNKAKVLDIVQLVEEKLKTTNSNVLPLLSRQLLLKRELKLSNDESYLFVAENNFHKSSCVELYLQCGLQSDKSNAYIDLTSQILSEPCYNVLRTQEQLGYIVFCGTRKANGVQGLRIIVQSNRHPNFVEQRVEAFIESMESVIEKMSAEEFERHKVALAAQKLEKPKRLSVQFQRDLNEISLQQYHFDRANSEVGYLKTITKEQFIDYYKDNIMFNGKNRHALFVHVISNVEQEGDSKPDESVQKLLDRFVIKDLASFKSSKELYPIIQPYIEIQPKGGKSKL